MNLDGQVVAIVGLGKSGIAAARVCLDRGAAVIGMDEAPRERLSPDALALRDRGARLLCGPLAVEPLKECDIVVVSPGIPTHVVLDEAAAAGCEVIGELELASRFITAPIALIGGTNGKSTVTAWIAAMLERAGQRVFVGGNFGTAMCEAVDQPWDVLVVEISSFQAERVPSLHAQVHALLNITDDHLDRYDSFQAYADAKGNPFVAMTAEDVAVLPAGDPLCAAQASRGGARRVHFSIEPGQGEVSLEGDVIVDRAFGDRYPIADLKVRGTHNLQNACAAIAVARALGAPPEAVTAALGDFTGLPHRHVLVAEVSGVRYYDDSKATNVGAAVAALRGLQEARAVLIAGGRDKHGTLTPLVEALADRGRALVVMGEAAERFAAAAEGVLPIVPVGSMAEAVREAAGLAEPGDAVLLSPACSSFDMFGSFPARGRAFADAVASELGGES
ncbi:MAG: UDP-N-acetylmuramoyl-L-alanine--D-glutamate ligase [Deltaproteobacteria bacterium]|nr:MAG: UDP-N-acetylmuramoyl-L-alanine--D-glutamate ligase [Deltaproteobacteria bacterium]